MGCGETMLLLVWLELNLRFFDLISTIATILFIPFKNYLFFILTTSINICSSKLWSISLSSVVSLEDIFKYTS